MPRPPASASGRRYAEAAFTVARDSGDFDTWLEALDRLAGVLRTPEARTVLTSPAVPPGEKRAALERAVPHLPPTVRSFLRILAERDRLDELPDVAAALRERVNRERGVVAAEVTTAVPLDAELERVIAQRLGAYLRHDPGRLAIRSRVDPAIIGGVLARVGDTLIDDSVRGRLERLRRALATPG